jgi:hypothetical protein
MQVTTDVQRKGQDRSAQRKTAATMVSGLTSSILAQQLQAGKRKPQIMARQPAMHRSSSPQTRVQRVTSPARRSATADLSCPSGEIGHHWVTANGLWHDPSLFAAAATNADLLATVHRLKEELAASQQAEATARKRLAGAKVGKKQCNTKFG